MSKYGSFSMDELQQAVFGSTSDARQMPVEYYPEGKTTVGERKRRPSKVTLELIKKFLMTQEEPVPLMDICDYLERRPSPALRLMMSTMVENGEVEKTHDWEAGPSVPRFLYKLVR